MATGHGTSFGEALRALIADHGGGRYTSYHASGWHAQLRELSGTERGRAAADAAGLAPSRRTFVAWLAESQTPSPANRARIADAYERVARRPLPDGIRHGTIEISGKVKIGDDVRDRGSGNTAPLRIDASEGDWDAFAEVWESGASDADLTNAFIEYVVWEDLGRPSEPIEFPGTSYSLSQ